MAPLRSPVAQACGVGPSLHLRSRLLAAGYTDDEIRRMLRDGGLARVRRGAYVAGAVPEDIVARHVLLVRAALAQLSPDAVVSHVSAAAVFGLPVWGLPLDRVHITRDRPRTGARRGSRVHTHSTPLGADEVVLRDGVPVTSPARTVLDVARAVPFEQAVVVADAALNQRLVDRAALQRALDMPRRWPGLPAARRVLAFADARAVGPGESRSRVAILRTGLPAPVLQWEVRRRDGRFVGEVDFGWPRMRTVGEFDGRIKYGLLVPPGQEPADVLYKEKLREDALRAEGLAVVRWGWRDLSDFAPVAERLKERFGWA
jgi:hypothetical protein